MSFFTQVKIKFLIIHYPCHLLLLPRRCLVLGIANHNLCNLQEELNIDIVKNRNIASKHLAGRRLHLNPHGTARLALDLKALIKKL